VFRLHGRDVALFIDRVTPLLLGGSEREAIAASLGEYDAASVFRLLDQLEGFGVIESADAGGDRWSGQTSFLEMFAPGGGAASALRLRAARVLLVGLEPWGINAAIELATAGVGQLDIADDGRVTAYDLPLVRGLREEDVGQPRATALQRVLARDAPWTACSFAPIEVDAQRALVMSRSDYDLIIVAAADDEYLVNYAVASFAQRHALRSMSATINGVEALVGPIVIPGTPCWNCTRLRLLANSAFLETDHELQEALLQKRPSPRARALLAPMPSLVGSAIVVDAIALISGYSPARLIGRLLVINLRSLETTLHTIVPMPWCAVCGGARRMQTPGAMRLGALTNPTELREALAGWVDPRVGAVRVLATATPDAEEPELPITASALLSSYTEGLWRDHGGEIGSGKGLDAKEALLGAVGEALERYSAARYHRDTLRHTAMADLEQPAVDPREFVLYDDKKYSQPDFPYRRFDAQTPIWWCRGEWLDTGEPVLVPALMTYYNFHAPPSERLCQVTSNGLAAGESDDDARLRASWELIERDAFMLTWLAKLTARRIEPDDSLDPQLREIIRQIGQAGARVELYLLNAGIAVPVVACLALGNGTRWPAITVALGAHADGPTAVRKAILEQGHVGPYVRRLMRKSDTVIPASPDAVRTLNDHALFYVPPSRLASFSFLRGTSSSILLAELPRHPAPTIADCTNALVRGAVRVVTVDVTSPDMRLSPFRVARALGVHMQPIYFGHHLGRTANPRLQTFAPGGINQDPHPLA
jgi:ribosomal protein S12 methylthiotransferase accessory factor